MGLLITVGGNFLAQIWAASYGSYASFRDLIAQLAHAWFKDEHEGAAIFHEHSDHDGQYTVKECALVKEYLEAVRAAAPVMSIDADNTDYLDTYITGLGQCVDNNLPAIFQ